MGNPSGAVIWAITNGVVFSISFFTIVAASLSDHIGTRIILDVGNGLAEIDPSH